MTNLDTLKKLGRYNIVSKIGEGGMGVVFKADDPVLGRQVALKVGKLAVMEPEQGEMDREYIRQCLKEARLAAQFIHPNIIITYDAGFENDLFYMALEYIDGIGLHHHSKRDTRLPRIQVLEIIFNTCHALEYIHNKGYAHLDVKPSNIMRTEMGEIKLMDFGITRALSDQPKVRNTKITGSVHYMSPEQACGESHLNHQTDIFSLGTVMYELLTGQRPFVGDDIYQVLNKIINDDPVPLNELIPEASLTLQEILDRAMSKERDQRFASAKAFADALLPIIKGRDSSTLNHQDKKKVGFLKRLLFFKHFQPSDLMEVIKISSWNSYKKDHWIIEPGDNEKTIYILVYGRGVLHLNNDMKMLREGDCFGDMAILYAMPRKAKVKAETDCIVMSINANLLNQASEGLQVKFLKEFYRNKTLQLVDANLKLIQVGMGK